MRLKPLCVFLLLCGLFPAKASADNRFIVRTTLGLQGLQTVCNPLLLTPICTVIGSGLGDPQGQLFTITTPLLSTICWLFRAICWELWMPKSINWSVFFRLGH